MFSFLARVNSPPYCVRALCVKFGETSDKSHFRAYHYLAAAACFASFIEIVEIQAVLLTFVTFVLFVSVFNRRHKCHGKLRTRKLGRNGMLKSISNTRGPKDMAPFHLLLMFENPNGFGM